MTLVRHDIRPADIVTRNALENAIASVSATGGSTNAALHLPAIAAEFGMTLTLDEFTEVADRTPLIADMRPGGRYAAADMYNAGGVGLVMRELLKQDLLHGDETTVDGRTIAKIAADTVETPGQPVVRTIDNPIKPTGGITVLKGSLAPDGCVLKLAGSERRQHRGPARVFDSETACFEAVSRAADRRGRRRRDPLRGPGRRARDAGDARRDRRARRRGARRVRRAADRRPVLRRHARPDDRPRLPGGGGGRPDRADRGGRHRVGRRRREGDQPRGPRRRPRRAPRALDAAAAAVHAPAPSRSTRRSCRRRRRARSPAARTCAPRSPCGRTASGR